MGMHLAALVVCHGLAHGRWFTVEDGEEAVHDGLGGGVFHLCQDHESGGAFDQCADR